MLAILSVFDPSPDQALERGLAQLQAHLPSMVQTHWCELVGFLSCCNVDMDVEWLTMALPIIFIVFNRFHLIFPGASRRSTSPPAAPDSRAAVHAAEVCPHSTW